MIEPSSQAMDSMTKPPSMFQFAQVANSSHNSQSSPTPSDGSSNQEDNYHQYHEPLDPPITDVSILHSPTLDSSNMSSPLLPNFNSSRSLLLNAVVPPPRPPQQTQHIHLNANLRSGLFNNNHNNGIATNSAICCNTTTRNQCSFNHHNMINQEHLNISDDNNNMKLTNDNNHEQKHNNQHHCDPSTSFSPRNIIQQNARDVSEDIYLCYVTSKAKDGSKNPRSTKSSSSNLFCSNNNNSAHFDESEKYEEVEDVEDEQSADNTPINSPFRSSTKSNLKISIEPSDLRFHCIKELIETEYNYVTALGMIIDSFARPLEKHLRKEDVRLIFHHIKQFQTIHTRFHGDLLKSCKQKTDNTNQGKSGLSPFNSNVTIHTSSNPSTPTSLDSISSPHNFLQSNTLKPVNTSPAGSFKSRLQSIDVSNQLSSCFLHYKDKFVLYGDYCATLSKAQNLIDELCSRDEIIAMQIEHCQHEANEGKFKLRDLLSLPMQRILKYHLLLSQLIKNTPTTHDDYYGLKLAHDAMVDLGQYINEVKRDTEALQIINDIQNSICELELPPDTHLVDYGRLVKDGELRVKSLDDTKVKSRYVFVFDKVILMCKSFRGVRGEQYSYKEAIVLNEYEINDSIMAANLQHAKHATKEKWSFYFSLVKNRDKYMYTFFAKTLESKNKWLEYINKAMDNSRPAVCRQGKTKHAFLMHTFDKATSCDHCSKLLHGRYYQGYRCKVCFLSAHKQCLIKTRPCGSPSVPAEFLSMAPLSSLDFKEPPSPSMKSNCSDDSNNVFINFAPSGTASPGHSFIFGRQQKYSNINEDNVNLQFIGQRQPSLSTGSSKDLTSVINVSLQNSSNNLIEQRRMLSQYSGSKSSPAINQSSTAKVKAIASFEGQNGQLSIKKGDILVVYQSMVKQNSRINSEKPGCSHFPNNSNTTWWLGRNLRTGQEGHFPSSIVVYATERKRVSCEDPQHTLDSIDGLLESGQPRYGNISPQSLTVDGFGNSLPFFGGGRNYVNCNSEDYLWFSGRMDRDRAQSVLMSKPHGTFLVRISPKQNGCYVISLNYNGQVKHMRIHVTEDNQFFLSQTRYFKSLVELVSWYERNSLMECFHLLDTRLVLPFKGSNR